MKISTKTIACCALFYPLFTLVHAQGQVDCKVIDKDKKPLPFAVVAMLNNKDSSLVKSAVTDKDGDATISPVGYGQYLIKVNMIGYSNYTSAPFDMNAEKPSFNAGVIEMDPSSVALKEVQVTYKRPFIEAQMDKTVVNVENSTISAGSSVLEVLQRSPGIVVDNNDNIAMRGKQGVIVLIDNKPAVLSGTDLGNMLRGMPAESVSQIELITNPSAKYDAAGNAGIINIKTKKDKRFGTNGSINAAYGQGKYPKSNEGFNINNRNKNFNIFGSYNFGYRKVFSQLNLDRKFYADGIFDGSYLQDNHFVSPYSTHSGKAGVDWYISNKTIAGMVVNGLNMEHPTKGNNTSQVFDAQHEYISDFATTNFSDYMLSNYAVNGNFRTTLDSLGRELAADMDYAHYNNNTSQDFTTGYYSTTGDQYLPAYLLHGNLRGTLEIKSVKADYTLPLNKKNKIETGIKSSIVDADNNLAFYDQSNLTEVYDTTKSNHFIYSENINAAYINYSKEADIWSYQLGLRAEQTNSKGKQVVLNNSFDNTYLQLFPSFFIQKKLSEMNQLGFTATRRIDRPDYRQLNPFKFFLDPSTYAEGNPYLNPQFTWSFELSETYNQRIITTLAYGRTTDNITQVLAPSTTEDKITIQTDANLALFEYYGLTESLPLSITKWWQTQNTVNIYYGHYSGNIANTNLSNGNLTFNINNNHSFTLPGKMTAELSFNYRAKEVYAYMTVEAVTIVSIGLQKSAFNKKVNIKMNVNDVFYSATDAANTHFNTYDENFKVKRDTRVATLALSYRFGNGSMSPRRKTGGAEDEKNRANSVGG